MRFRRMMSGLRAVSIVAVAVLASALLVTSADADAGRGVGPWTGAWTTSMIAPSSPVFGLANWSVEGFADQSVRQVVRVSQGGSAVRIRLSNVYGGSPLLVAGATIGIAGTGASVRQGTLHALTFRRSPSAAIPAGLEAVSDPVRMRVEPLDRLTITLYFTAPTGPTTFHAIAFATSFRASGDHRLDSGGGAYPETSSSWYYLAGVEVAGSGGNGNGAVVAFGDSITDGAMSTVDGDNRYPDELAERLVAAGRPMGVLNAGIGGNQVLGTVPGFGASGVDRFQRDVLGQPRARSVIILEGINDIAISTAAGDPVTAAAIIDGYARLIKAAHDRGIRVIGATITPTKGSIFPAYYTDSGEAVRDAVNNWIRSSAAYDAVVDLDRLFADPADPDRMRAEYNSGDGVHPNDAGMRAIAEAIDLDTL